MDGLGMTGCERAFVEGLVAEEGMGRPAAIEMMLAFRAHDLEHGARDGEAAIRDEHWADVASGVRG